MKNQVLQLQIYKASDLHTAVILRHSFRSRAFDLPGGALRNFTGVYPCHHERDASATFVIACKFAAFVWRKMTLIP